MSVSKPSVKISIIIPALDEEKIVVPALQALQGLRGEHAEIILVDGGSEDNTAILAAPLVDQLLKTSKGRALQMNQGALAACGKYLLFLHVDTQLPKNISWLVQQWSRQQPPWGFFRVRLSGRAWLLRFVETLMNWRSRLTGIGTGDQALFVDRDLFAAVSGYAEIPLMEDISICKKLKKHSPPCWVDNAVITSSRRWEDKGILRTVLLMWRLRLAYFMGTPPEQLVYKYYS